MTDGYWGTVREFKECPQTVHKTRHEAVGAATVLNRRQGRNLRVAYFTGGLYG